MSHPPFFPLYGDDLVATVRRRCLKPEEVGALIMFMCMQWEEQGNVQNAKARFRTYTGWDSRLANRLLNRLTGIGVVQDTPEGMYSERMTSEITKYCERVKASVVRQAKRRQERNEQRTSPSYPLAIEELSNSYPIANQEVSEKLKEINKGQSTDGGIYKNLDIDKDKTLGQSDPIDLLGDAIGKLPKAKPKPRPSDEQFVQFWDAYPRRVKKAEARKKFTALTPVDATLAIEGARRYARQVASEARDPTKIMHPTTYLNQRVFEDVVDTANAEPNEIVEGKRWGWWRDKGHDGRPKLDGMRSLPAARWRDGFAKTRPNGRWPWWKFGAPPGHDECAVPDEILEETGWIDVYKGQEFHD